MCSSTFLSLIMNTVSAVVNHVPGISEMEAFQSRIVGGSDATIEDYPYQVSLQHRGEHQCGASIISKDWVLTAGHCVDGINKRNIKVRAGSSYVYAEGSLHQAVTVYRHPDFDPLTFDYDIAVIKVEPPFKFDKLVQSIQLPPPDYTPEDGEFGNVTGWGTISSSRKKLPYQLQSVRLPITTRDRCQRSYLLLYISKRMICAGFMKGRRDACQGDSGGPLVMDGVLVGAVSWGLGCGMPGYLGVYSNIAYFRRWIKKKTGL